MISRDHFFHAPLASALFSDSVATDKIIDNIYIRFESIFDVNCLQICKSALSLLFNLCFVNVFFSLSLFIDLNVFVG